MGIDATIAPVFLVKRPSHIDDAAMMEHWALIWGGITVLFYGMGILSSVRAIMTARTSQGAIAWTFVLITVPFIAVPLYWVLGRNSFHGYVDARKINTDEVRAIQREVIPDIPNFVPEPESIPEGAQVFESLAGLPFLSHNGVDLLIDWQETFDAIFAAIDEAKKYVLVQFFIVKDDGLGRALRDKLLAARSRGVEVYFLYDEVGSNKLGRAYIDSFKKAGAHITAFNTTQGDRNRFQINFRNHRKIVVVDGTVGFVGGHNVGDEYMGRDERFGHWRDTHMRVYGPAVLLIQIVFVTDWNWATKSIPSLNWEMENSPDGRKQSCLILPSGPETELETFKLFLLQCLHIAKERVWLISPYFVPDSDVISALHLAAARGVEVRIMLPAEPDHMIVYLASFTYLAQLDHPNIQFYRYERGFLHQKALLVDDTIGAVGTANIDNRSFRLNFEVTLINFDTEFIHAVYAMMTEDFCHCKKVGAESYSERRFAFRFATQVCRLMEPIL